MDNRKTLKTLLTALLHSARAGDKSAQAKAIEIVYAELRKVAGGQMKNERPDHTLQPTALVHEAYLRMFPKGSGPAYENRAHFFAIGARIMREILIDHARGKRAKKRGAGRVKVTLSDVDGVFKADADIEVVHDALTELEAVSPEIARIIELKYFGGLTNNEIAQSLGLSYDTVRRRTTVGMTFLKKELKK